MKVFFTDSSTGVALVCLVVTGMLYVTLSAWPAFSNHEVGHIYAELPEP